MLSGFGKATKAEGAMVTMDQATEAYTSRYTHNTVALGFAITEEAIEDNLYDRLAADTQELLQDQWRNQNKSLRPTF